MKGNRGGRKMGHLTSELTRERIRTAMILNRLQKFVGGSLEMSPHQVTAALGLLKKTIPDLQSIEHSGFLEADVVHTISGDVMSEAEWAETYADRAGSGRPN
jgi:hypothetical protein